MAVIRSVFRYGVGFGMLALLALTLDGRAQTSATQPDLRSGKFNLDKLLGARGNIPSAPSVLFEGAIDPDEYIVGPGDQLNVVFWQPTYTEYPATVTGEGALIIPYVGAVPVSGISLTQARQQIQTQVGKTMRWGQVTVSLMQPRQFRVHVSGMVEMPGTYAVSATQRVADAIRLAGGLKRKQTFANGDTSSMFLGSLRNIELLAQDGKLQGRADLLLFEKSGHTAANPYVRDGIVIHVPACEDGPSRIGIFGSVAESGLYEFVSGDRVADAIALGGGLKRAADSSVVRIVAENGTQQTVDLRRGGLDQTLNGGDRVYVHGMPDTSRAGSIVLTGEVSQPGGYPIRVGETLLQDVLRDAGGLLPTAAVNSVRLIRKPQVDPIAVERNRVMMASLVRQQLPTNTADPSLAAEFLRWDYATVVVDLSDTSSKRGDAKNIKLQDGDVLDVPRNPLGVRVLGSVNYAGEVPWRTGKKFEAYLAEAGGVNKAGWKARAVIIKARNGSQLRYQSSLTIDPGDVLFIPQKYEASGWDQFKDFVAVTAQVVTVIFVVKNVSK